MKIKDGIKLGIGVTIGCSIARELSEVTYKGIIILYQKLINKGIFDSETVDDLNKILKSCECKERFNYKPENTTKNKIGFAVD